MRHIIHDWSDELSLQILKNIRSVIPPHGRVLVVETIVPEGNDPSPAKLFDIMMMLFPPNGLSGRSANSATCCTMPALR
jgi:hypothetical protein